MALANLSEESKTAIHWFDNNSMSAQKFQEIFLNLTDTNLVLQIDDITPEDLILLGVLLDDDKISFNSHIKNICKKAVLR